MPADFNGYWKMVSNDNFEEYLKALDVNVAVRKIANLLKPDKEILQNGDHMIIKTLSTFRNYIMEFDVGKEFEEDLSGVDDRKCMQNSLPYFAKLSDKGRIQNVKPERRNYRERISVTTTVVSAAELSDADVMRQKEFQGKVTKLPMDVAPGAASCTEATTVSWDGDKLLCVQNGEKEGRGWTQWIEGDEMHL
ncbi:hypothetical protein DV515_00011657, partial [Chloebia gouldiae]